MYCLCRSSKTIAVRIVLLDETDFMHEIQDDLPGQAILDVIFARLNLIETAYFGIRYIDQENQTHWLDPSARLSRQLKGDKIPFDLYFGVKFYAADPCKLVEEITRYQLYLQVKQDVLQGRLPVSFELAAELGAFVIQAELGDYDPRKHLYGYVSEFRLLSNQTKDFENRIQELHQQLKGVPASQAEYNYLDKAKWHDMFGVDLHPVLGEDSVEYFLGLTPSGIVVLRNKTTVAHYYWPRIAKVYFKGRYFMLRVCDKNNEVSTYGFETPKKTACKHLWKCCVEHHAFFRLIRVAPMQAQSGTSDIFALGSRFRGRTERQAAKDAASRGRSPPVFTRTPSRRQARRIIDDHNEEKNYETPKYIKQEIKTVSIPQPAQTFDSPYRSTCSIPANINAKQTNNGNGAPDSPRSTRSAPWMRSQQRGLFGISSSPKSVRSASTRASAPANNRYRSSSVESHSSNDSKSTRRRRHRSRRQSDNESEMSRGSGRSGRSHNSRRRHRRHRSKHRRNECGSDNESKDRSCSNHRKSTGSIELIDSGQQWREVQRKQAELNKSSVQKASVIKSSLVTKSHSQESGSNSHHHRSRRHKKHRSPSDKIWSSELTKHLKFGLIDTEGMTEDQLREIPYTVVETNHTAKRPNGTLKVHKTSHVNNRIDRIREYPKDANGNDNSATVNGSIRSASTISSSRDYDRNSGLIRMMSSLSMGDFISPAGSSLSPLDSSGLRVSHEHTDSGLGADQDYAYSSERSSDSAKYGTNKSSGASVTSAHTKSGHSSSSANNNNINHGNKNHHHHSVSNRKPPLCPNRQHKLSAVPAVHNSTQILNANNNRLINNSNTLFQNNHYTFSLTRNMTGNNRNYGSGIGVSSCGYLESSATLSSASTAAPYHFYYNGSGGGFCANSGGGYAVDNVSVNRGTKSDVGVSTRRQSQLQNQPHVHNMSKSNNNNINNNSVSSMKTDYLENYKTGVDRLNLINNNNNNNINNYNKAAPNTSTITTIQKSSSTVVGPLVYLDSNQNQNQNHYHNQRDHYRHNQNKTINMGGGGVDTSAEMLHTGHSNDLKIPNRSSSLELILTPIIQSRRAQ